MSDVTLEFHGIHQLGPEDDVCALLRWPQENRLIPVWLSAVDGIQLAAVFTDQRPNRPTTHDLLCEVLEAAGGVEAIEIVNHHQGTFMVDIHTAQGEVLDARLSDALAIAEHFKVPIVAESALLAQVSVFASEEDIKEYFDLELPTPTQDARDSDASSVGESTSASGNAQADADFEQMMRSLGMDESDFDMGEEDGRN
ncbi:bifunctional nuclease family protein [Corynebacterium accolens]|uniref:bifunctional nuclease family protein n=1 Tax=Corynebacterium accolens TaxID=38284 RepID=UPI00254E139A|nr:bifunctional nuclease family protein [Corynebacterium accolens]MDK8471217.1 bifunctional nuclease family protein [Corynebacterium accolens]MDK8617298.1 bifunctional nuclease family protein [Corynebacterium accolens]